MICLANGQARQSPIMFIKINAMLTIIKISLKVVVSNLNPFPSSNPKTSASLPTNGIPKRISGNNWLNAPALLAVSEGIIL